MFIETEGTPNPATLKFLPGRDILGNKTADFADADAACSRRWPMRCSGWRAWRGCFWAAILSP